MWAGALLAVISPLLMQIVPFIPNNDNRQFLIFFPYGTEKQEAFSRIAATGAYPLDRLWHGGWLVRTDAPGHQASLKAAGAFLILDGTAVAICGTDPRAALRRTVITQNEAGNI